MKKVIVILALIFTMFLGTYKVKADDTIYQLTDFDSFVELVSNNSEKVSNIIDSLYSSFNGNITTGGSSYNSSDYPYHVIYVRYSSSDKYVFLLRTFSESFVYDDFNTRYNSINLSRSSELSGFSIQVSVDSNFNLLSSYIITGFSNSIGYDYYSNGSPKYYVLYSNFDLINSSDGSFQFTNLDNTTFIVRNNESLPTVMGLVDNTFIPSSSGNSNYVEINLNNYAYVGLSLKDYTKNFSSIINVKGEYCITSVYNYGMVERKSFDMYKNTRMQECYPYQENYSSVNLYVTSYDITNHAIYWIKPNDKELENKIKVDTSIFNIHYITEEEADNPIINVNGTNYTPIPFNQLTDTANKSTEDGYISGESVRVGDLDNPAYPKDLFSSPLTFLKSISDGITAVFDIVRSLFTFLPTELQIIIYGAFSVAIVLGIIKIIL